MPRQRLSGLSLGVLLLASKMYEIGFTHIPPVTLIFIVVQALLFLGIINPPWDRYDVCLSGESILHHHNYRRLFLSALEHADDIHLYFNMVSLLLKGHSLEKRFGSRRFFILLIIFTLATSVVYVAIAKVALEMTYDFSYMRQCAIGFSGVLFALKVLTTHYSYRSYQYIGGFPIPVPSKYAVWFELLLIHLMVPRASFFGHLAGILVGLLYIWGPLEMIVSTLDHLTFGFFRGPSYTYTRTRLGTGQRQQYEGSSYSQRQESNYGWNYRESEQRSRNRAFSPSGSLHAEPQKVPLEMDEMRRRRLDRFN